MAVASPAAPSPALRGISGSQGIGTLVLGTAVSCSAPPEKLFPHQDMAGVEGDPLDYMPCNGASNSSTQRS